MKTINDKRKKIIRGIRKWRGAISYCRKLTKEAVICLFADGWRASATGNHTHAVDFLHFYKNRLTRKKLELAEKYFSLKREQEKYSPLNPDGTENSEYFSLERQIQNIVEEINT